MSFRLKTILGIASIEAILLAILLSLTLNYLETTNYKGLEQRASSTAALFATSVKNAVLSYDLATIHAFTSELKSNPDIVYVAVVGENNQPLSIQGQAPAQLNAALFQLDNHQTNEKIYHIKQDIKASDIVFGSVWIGFDLSQLHQQIADAQHWSTLIVIGEMSLVALFSYVLGAYLTRRLSELKNAADQIASGHRDIDLSTKGEDELASVSKAFQNMVENLKLSESQMHIYQQQLLSANESLEYKVSARTEDLLRSNRELRDTNATLKSTQAKLIETEKMASIGTMAAGVAHEINNPIAAVKSNLQSCFEYLETYHKWIEQAEQIIEQKGAAPAELQQWKQAQFVDYLHDDFNDSLKDAETCVNRVAKIVSALQHYSQHNEDSPQHFTAVDLFIALDKALNQISLPINVQVTINPSIAKQPAIWGLADELKTLFEQVIKNAVQACSRVQSSTQNHSNVTIYAQTDDNRVHVMIQDTGPGIPENESNRVYDPFYTTLPVGEGMGLGLTYAYDIVRLHQGDIDIQSTAQGTCVTVSLPIAKAHLDVANID
ncbi:His Kinase A (phospho-acceptor) domain-containing protein [Vibrio xiamenensis]|uniref:histidine kinase n=1 Tax=Vibrio xiamenensis TaxID=861298 RepID=A0A1G8AP80_9VIBR|nr:ATP-binding protein [Vibrio xiamenensis]SDH22693.1 His Kinase A (phospho-acceptor) domain-containing protein [Vibrio xiamenensis]